MANDDNYAPKVATLTLDKETAAMRQTHLAILAHEAGDLDAAVTLAGAADGMLPENPNQNVFGRLRDDPQALTQFNRKDWVQLLNWERDWLKHPTPQMNDQVTITALDAGFIIIRAMTKLPKWSDKMVAFKNWYMSEMNLPS